MITITWSWFSFFVGIFVVLTLEFWGLMTLAVIQYRKNKSKSDALTDALRGWTSKD